MILHTDYASLPSTVILSPQDFRAPAYSNWIDTLASLPKCDPLTGPWIAGGAVRRLILGSDPFSADIDYFSASQDDYRILCARLESLDVLDVQSTVHHTTYRIDTGGIAPLTVQAVKSRFRPSLTEHLLEFDFTICHCGWDGHSFHTTRQTLMDIQQKRLTLQGVLHSYEGSWQRVSKYAKQGFRPTPETIQTLLDGIQESSEDSELGY